MSLRSDVRQCDDQVDGSYAVADLRSLQASGILAIQEVAMAHLTVALPEERLQQLEEIAARYNVSPEALVLVSIEELLTRSDESFRNALDYVLTKNAELYRRLA